jgi:hypothetical protein
MNGRNEKCIETAGQKSQGKRSLGIDGRITLKRNLRETVYAGVKWIHCTLNTVQW